MPVTIRDVADKAGVSISTVSSVINETKYVSPVLRERVEEAIKELGYIPSLVGRALSSKRSSMLAYVIPTVSNPFFAAMTQTVQSEVLRSGFGLLTCSAEDDESEANRYESFLVGAHVDGVMISPSSGRSVEEQCKPFIDRGIPVVVLAGARSMASVDSVVLDDRYGMNRLARYLLDLGHTRFAFIGKAHSFSTEVRLQALKATLDEFGFTLPQEHTAFVSSQRGSSVHKDAYRMAKSLLTGTNLPTAILCHNDMLAIGVLQACYDLGLRVPDDVSVAGFDDTLASVTSPPLTTLRVPLDDMARTASQLLLSRVDAKDREASQAPSVHLFEPELVVRASTGPPRLHEVE